ncbi:MAG: hypothetical protein COZ07_07420 [Candidatus Infernicultor aquiphilus]|uniref:Uncharacterized protein n=1 Tax=Candidatus Infernicultor aquiphilus TaxID=1805029 RepID=A0A1J5GCZ1_9BACT|nr:MAG: hypothetical protein AUK42_04110 [Candidatus Atribacteria bacterium CG2_30_33_13]PIY31950.1 MAG: hypothetical protein COZ07_07420 [Candidatus Atribacteria bacterium CG_4_10_14_3_um_filter_34_13]
MRILYNKDKKGVNCKIQDEIASVVSLPRNDILPPHPALSPQERGKRGMGSRLRGNDIWGSGNDPSEIRFHGAGRKGWRVEGYFLLLIFSNL